MRESKGVWSPHNYACLRALSSSCARRRRTSQALSTSTAELLKRMDFCLFEGELYELRDREGIAGWPL
jgi:hypothetical protein